MKTKEKEKQQRTPAAAGDAAPSDAAIRSESARRREEGLSANWELLKPEHAPNWEELPESIRREIVELPAVVGLDFGPLGWLLPELEGVIQLRQWILEKWNPVKWTSPNPPVIVNQYTYTSKDDVLSSRSAVIRQILMGKVAKFIDQLASMLPDERQRPAFKAEVLTLFEQAAGITAPDKAPAETATPRLDDAASETTTPQASAPVAPRLKWEKDATPDENPAAFAWRAYQAEAKVGTLHRGLIYDEDRELYWKLHSWLRSHDMPEGIDIPKKRDWNTRELAKLGKLADDPQELMRLGAVARRRAATPNI